MMGHAYTDEMTHRKGPNWPDGMNEYAEADGSTATIKARVEPTTRRVLINGVEYQSSFSVMTESEIRTGDTLTFNGLELTVAQATPESDLGGRLDHYEAVC